jgi:preprotein translocase subunit SecE
MAKAVAENVDIKPTAPVKTSAPGSNAVTRTFAETVDFLRNVRSEISKLVTPTRAEVQATTTVVIVTVFIFGLYFFLVDFFIGRGIQYLLHQLGGTK